MTLNIIFLLTRLKKVIGQYIISFFINKFIGDIITINEYLKTAKYYNKIFLILK
jgi:hypothetical protein